MSLIHSLCLALLLLVYIAASALPTTCPSKPPIASNTNTWMGPLLVTVRGGSSCRNHKLMAVSTPTWLMSTDSSPIHAFRRSLLDARKHLVAAAVARSSSIFIMFPIDTIKTRMQMEQVNPLRISGLYNGVAGSLLGQIPYGVLTFGSYEMYKKYLVLNWPIVPPIFLYALSAVLGDLTGSGWLCPSEVVKQKLQAGLYPSTIAAVLGIWTKNGLIGFYEGYLSAVARDVPFRVAQLTSYEVTKNLYLRLKDSKRTNEEKLVKDQNIKRSKKYVESLQLSSVEAAFCGAFAGTFSAAVTAPLDRIKTLLMTDSAANGGSVIACATKIWKAEGFRGYTQGIMPRVVYIGPSVAIFFIVYEEVQQRLSHLFSY